MVRRAAVLAICIAVAATAAGCRSKHRDAPAAEAASARLLVTEDYGAHLLRQARVAPGQSAMAALQGVARVETLYGGRAIVGIDGHRGTWRDRDWALFVDGRLAPVGATDVRLRAGDRVWLDLRRYTPAHGEDVPAVVAHPVVPVRRRVVTDATAPGGLGRLRGRAVWLFDGRGLRPCRGCAVLVFATAARGQRTVVAAGPEPRAVAAAADAIARRPGLLDRRYAAAFDGNGRLLATAGRP